MGEPNNGQQTDREHTGEWPTSHSNLGPTDATTPSVAVAVTLISGDIRGAVAVPPGGVLAVRIDPTPDGGLDRRAEHILEQARNTALAGRVVVVASDGTYITHP